MLKKQDTRVKLTRQTLADDPLQLDRPKMPSELYFMYDDGKAISGKEEATIKCEFDFGQYSCAIRYAGHF